MIAPTLPDWVQAHQADLPPCPDDEQQVAVAIELAQQNVRRGTGGPFGAAIFDAQGNAVALAVNMVVPHNCSLAHAEIMACMTAQAAVGRARINDDGNLYSLATSAQPCCQCYGATVWAGIDRLLIGARNEDVTRLTEFDEGPLPQDWVGELEARGIVVQRDILREQACAVLREYSTSGGALY